MASFQNVRRFPKPSAFAGGIGVSAFRMLAGLRAAFSDAAFGALVATHELATLQRNEPVPAYASRPARGRSLAGSATSSTRSSW
jgi:hypothetical protein